MLTTQGTVFFTLKSKYEDLMLDYVVDPSSIDPKELEDLRKLADYVAVSSNMGRYWWSLDTSDVLGTVDIIIKRKEANVFLKWFNNFTFYIVPAILLGFIVMIPIGVIGKIIIIQNINASLLESGSAIRFSAF